MHNSRVRVHVVYIHQRMCRGGSWTAIAVAALARYRNPGPPTRLFGRLAYLEVHASNFPDASVLPVTSHVRVIPRTSFAGRNQFPRIAVRDNRLSRTLRLNLPALCADARPRNFQIVVSTLCNRNIVRFFFPIFCYAFNVLWESCMSPIRHGTWIVIWRI